MSDAVETLGNKIILLLIDKVAIGALIGFAALCASILLERIKAFPATRPTRPLTTLVSDSTVIP